MAYLMASLLRATGECDDALPLYDETIALQPVHDGALLGRTVCLTSLRRHQLAIDAATMMITLALPNVQLAYYWRAVNERALARLDSARADIERARKPAPTGEVLTMAGIIEYEQLVKENMSQHYASAFNAASYSFQAGNAARARELIKIAARDPALAAEVAKLRVILGG
jgi:tetratricopeptide (TPR) repeat protein